MDETAKSKELIVCNLHSFWDTGADGHKCIIFGGQNDPVHTTSRKYGCPMNATYFVLRCGRTHPQPAYSCSCTTGPPAIKHDPARTLTSSRCIDGRSQHNKSSLFTRHRRSHNRQEKTLLLNAGKLQLPTRAYFKVQSTSTKSIKHQELTWHSQFSLLQTRYGTQYLYLLICWHSAAKALGIDELRIALCKTQNQNTKNVL